MRIYEFNEASGKPLVHLAYANGFLPQTYRRALQPLFDDYRVVSSHLRPMWGDVQPESLRSWSQMGDDLLNALDSITDQPVIGIGHSVGAIMTLYASLKCPERFSRLILIDPTLLPRSILRLIRLMRLVGQGDRMPLVQGALRRRREWDSLDVATASLRKKPLFARWPDDVFQSYMDSMIAPASDGMARLLYSPEWEAQIYRTVDTSVWKLPGQIKHRALILRGELTDTFTEASAATFHKLNPGIEIVTVKGAGHLVPQEQPEQVGKLIVDFLKH